MDINTWRREHRGPFRADQLGDGHGYELTNGHPVPCLPLTPQKAGLRLSVAQMIGADPAVERAETGLGFSPDPMTLRAPDIVVWPRVQGSALPKESRANRLRRSTALLLSGSQASAWMTQPPPMTVELAEADRDEDDLQRKIEDLIDGGVRVVWVARFAGPRRVDIYTPGQPPRTASLERNLTAPEILSLPVPALGLFDREVALEQVLRRQLRHQSDN